MRSMASGAAFHRAYPHATQQAFLEAHELAFQWFGGVFSTLRFDNLSSAVKKILRGRQREETTRFIAFRSHWGFQAEFCTPGEGHEKDHVSYCTPLVRCEDTLVCSTSSYTPSAFFG
jgi:transposase